MAIRDTRRSANLFRFIDDLTTINDGENLKEAVTKFTLLSLRAWRSKGYPVVFLSISVLKLNIKNLIFSFTIRKVISHFWYVEYHFLEVTFLQKSFIRHLKQIHFSSFWNEFIYAKHFAKRLRLRYLECQKTMVKHCFFLTFFKDIE